MPALETARLRLRPWRDADRPARAASVADPCEMRYFAGTLTRAESDARIDRYVARLSEDGFAMLAVERLADGMFLGTAGLQRIATDCGVTGEVEVGWHIARAHWRQGYAFEAARAAVEWGFGPLGLRRVYAITAASNAPSRALMGRLGMAHRPELDFDHAPHAVDSPHRRHVIHEVAR